LPPEYFYSEHNIVLRKQRKQESTGEKYFLQKTKLSKRKAIKKKVK